MRYANRLLAYLIFRIANKLLAICRQLAIKKIYLLRVLKVLSIKALGFRNSRFQILTEIPIESATINIFRVTSHDVTTERPRFTCSASIIWLWRYRVINLF